MQTFSTLSVYAPTDAIVINAVVATFRCARHGDYAYEVTSQPERRTFSLSEPALRAAFIVPRNM